MADAKARCNSVVILDVNNEKHAQLLIYRSWLSLPVSVSQFELYPSKFGARRYRHLH